MEHVIVLSWKITELWQLTCKRTLGGGSCWREGGGTKFQSNSIWLSGVDQLIWISSKLHLDCNFCPCLKAIQDKSEQQLCYFLGLMHCLSFGLCRSLEHISIFFQVRKLQWRWYVVQNNLYYELLCPNFTLWLSSS